MEFVENEKGELTDIKLPENEEGKENVEVPENGEKVEVEGEGSNDNKAEEAGEQKGEESILQNAEVKEEMEKFIEVLPQSSGEGAAVSKKKGKVKKFPGYTMYLDKVLKVGGRVGELLHFETAKLKNKLFGALGSGNVRIRPRWRHETDIYVYFGSEELLKKGKEFLEKPGVLPGAPKLEIVSGEGLNEKPDRKELLATKKAQKRKMMDSDDESSGKREKRSATEELFYFDVDYKDQVAIKNDAARKIVEAIGNNLKLTVPPYRNLIRIKEKKNKKGLICKLDDLHECSPAHRLYARAKFSIGIDIDTEEIVVGFDVGGAAGDDGEARVKKDSPLRKNILPNVLEAADVFEKLVRSSGREVYKGSEGFWQSLVVRTNTEKKIMLFVTAQSFQEKAQEELKYLKNLLTDFYENGEGKNTKVTCIYSQVSFMAKQKRGSGSFCELSWGSEYLEEKFLGMRILLEPRSFFYFNVHVAAMVCDTVLKMLNPTKRIAALEMGCSTGFMPMHLRKYMNQVLCIGTRSPATATVLKEKSSKCMYYAGTDEKLLRKLNEIPNARASAVISAAPQTFNAKLALAIRKCDKIKHIVVVTKPLQRYNCRALASLMKPPDKALEGCPFFPTRVTPVDTMPNAKHFTLVILLERMGADSLPIPQAIKTSLSMRKQFDPSKMKIDRREPRENWNQRSFPPVNALPIANAVNPLAGTQQLFAGILQRQEFINKEIVAEEHRRRLQEERDAELYRQQLLDEKEREAEEYRLRLLEEKEHEAEEYRLRLIREAAEFEKRLKERRQAEEYKLKQRIKTLEEEEEYRRTLLLQERERQLQELQAKPSIQGVLADSLNEASLSRLDNETAVKLKRVIAEAIRGAGILPTEAASRQGRMLPEEEYPVAGRSTYDTQQTREPWGNFSQSRRAGERDLMDNRQNYSNFSGGAAVAAQSTFGRSDRLPFGAKREMPYGRKSGEVEARNNPVPLLSLNVASSMPQQQIRGNDRWRSESNSTYGIQSNQGQQLWKPSNDSYMQQGRGMQSSSWGNNDRQSGSTRNSYPYDRPY